MNYDNSLVLFNKYKDLFDRYQESVDKSAWLREDFEKLSLIERRKEYRRQVSNTFATDELVNIMEQLIERADELDDSFNLPANSRIALQKIIERNERGKSLLNEIAIGLGLTPPEWD